MAYDVFIANAAQRDKERIASYLLHEARSQTAARGFLDGLERVTGNLAQFPEMYPRVAEGRLAAGGYRRARFGSYVALYRVNDDERAVEVARVFHALQDYARLL